MLLGKTAVNLATARPSFSRARDEQRPLAEAFNDARMWFNHVVKVQDADLINVKYLWRFITRGAMILCANNHCGVDIILPVCFSGEILSRDTVTAILIQVKNDTTFDENVRGWLFDMMDPFDINVFSQGNAPR